jgi:hypothetical protein
LKTTQTKYENNWREKSLENLEKDNWSEPDYESHLVKTSHQLMKKPLKDFEIEDLRIMIGQNIGLTFLIPLALEKLRENILAEGDFYEGDLLNSVLTSDNEFWIKESNRFGELEEIIQNNVQVLSDVEPTLLEKFNELEKQITK